MFSVRPEKEKALRERMTSLGIEEKDLHESFVRSSGSGGQKVNKTSSCVYLKHLPSGTEVKCQKDRSLIMNRYHARVILCTTIENQQLGNESPEAIKAAKIRKQKQRSSRRTKAKSE